jgi:multicomponent Na+:H+ antiporter subunit D
VTWLVPLPVVLPLIGAGLTMLVGRSRAAQRAVSITVLGAVVVVTLVLAVRVDRHGPLVMQAGGWPAPVGISLVADRLSTIMLAVAAVMLLTVLVYAIGQPGVERNHVGFQSAYLVLAAGVAAAFVTGDLFTLYVAFEMLLTASYVLITLGGRREQVRSAMTYVVISLLASGLFIALLALVYTATGTVNMADLSEAIGDLPRTMQLTLAVMLLVVFGIKAAVFPLFFWLPDSYPIAPTPVTAIFAGLLTKVGVYAILRTQTLLFPADVRPTTLLAVVAAATMLVGMLGAVAQDDIKRILSFQMVGHVGFMVMGIAIMSVAGLAAAIFYTVHHIVVNTALFLTGGLVEHAGGSSRLTRLGGMVRAAPTLAVLFLVAALSMAGLPPFSGFVAKVGLIEAGTTGGRYGLVAVSLVASLLTVLSMMKIWSGVFWNPRHVAPESPRHEPGRLGGPALMVAPTAAVATLSLVLALAAGPLYNLSLRAAGDLVDRGRYTEAVTDP